MDHIEPYFLGVPKHDSPDIYPPPPLPPKPTNRKSLRMRRSLEVEESSSIYATINAAEVPQYENTLSFARNEQNEGDDNIYQNGTSMVGLCHDDDVLPGRNEHITEHEGLIYTFISPIMHRSCGDLSMNDDLARIQKSLTFPSLKVDNANDPTEYTSIRNLRSSSKI